MVIVDLVGSVSAEGRERGVGFIQRLQADAGEDVEFHEIGGLGRRTWMNADDVNGDDAERYAGVEADASC